MNMINQFGFPIKDYFGQKRVLEQDKPDFLAQLITLPKVNRKTTRRRRTRQFRLDAVISSFRQDQMKPWLRSNFFNDGRF